MSVSSSGRASSQGQKLAKLKGDTTVEIENNQGNSLNTNAEGQDINKLVKLESPSQPEIHDTLAISGERPISPSDLEVDHTVNAYGIRPIGVNTMHIVDNIHQSGIRPIASSGLVISQTYSVMGNRPVASNMIDDADSIMGFLD